VKISFLQKKKKVIINMGLLEYFFKKLLITEFVKTDKAQLFLKKTYLS
jgi:hypothetical protein